MAVDRITLAGLLLALTASVAGAAAARGDAFDAAGERQPAVRVRLGSAQLAGVAPSTPPAAKLRIDGVDVPATSETLAFVVERFEVFAPDAVIVVHGEDGDRRLPRPRNVYFRGQVAGEAGSRVFLEVQPNGRTRGVIARPGDDMYLIDNGDPEDAGATGAPGRLQAERADGALLKDRGEPWQCGQAELPPRPNAAAARDLLATLADSSATVDEPAVAPTTAQATSQYAARVAIETDYEYYQKFNNATNATNYVGSLLGYASTIYAGEINTSLVVQSVSLWTTSSDPWTQTSTTCGLMEFGRYWNKNKTGVSRTIAHFLSGKSLGGGIAWVGVLCSGAFGASANCPSVPTDASWGGGYGLTANISGTFDVNNPIVMWDIVAVSHEIGHNFNSPHSHCYNGIGGSSSPIDQCYSGQSGCYSGSASLPGPAGAGSGTIMSYCHLVRSSYSDISLNFGTGHPYGVQPGREAARMSSHVASVASGNPSCLAVVNPPPSAPSVTGVSPLTGLTNANTAVTITGAGFQSGATVTLGTGGDSVNASSVVVVNDRIITAAAPPHATGAVRVTVTNPDSQSGYRENAFFYAPPATSLSFYTMTPCRLLDTRNPTGPLGGPALAANGLRVFTATGGTCAVPATAKAISANVTVISGSAGGYLSLYPGNAFPLGTSTVSFPARITRAGQAMLQLATDGTGRLGMQNASGGTNHVLVDVNGYFQ